MSERTAAQINKSVMKSGEAKVLNGRTIMTPDFLAQIWGYD